MYKCHNDKGWSRIALDYEKAEELCREQMKVDVGVRHYIQSQLYPRKIFEVKP